MATFTVNKVRMESCSDGVHEHIEGVCIDSGTHYTRKQVVDSIHAGNTWKSKAAGYEATIKTLTKCPRCSATPYIKTNPDSTMTDNLDNLPRC